MRFHVDAVPLVAFVIVALAAGLFYAFLIPPFDVPDEAAHVFRAYATSGGVCVGQERTAIPHALIEMQGDFPPRFETQLPAVQSRSWQTLRSGAPLSPASAASLENVRGNLYSCVPYLPAGLAFAVSRAIHLPAASAFYSGRVINLILFVAMTAVAVSLLPVGRWLLLSVALLPMTLHQAASFSADAITIGLSFLYFAYCCRLGLSETATVRQCVLLIGLAGLLSLCKFNVWLVLAGLLIPAARLGSIRKKLVLVVALLAASAGAAGIWQLWNESNIRKYEAAQRLGSINIQRNAQVLVREPSVFAGSAIRSARALWPTYVEMIVGRLGHAAIRLPQPVILIAAFLLLICLLIRDGPDRIALWQRGILLGIALAAAVSMFSLMWILETTERALTEAYAGRSMILGIQGRYFIPILPAALLGLWLPRLEIGKAIQVLIIACWGLVNAVAISVVHTSYHPDIDFRQLPPISYEGKLVSRSGVGSDSGKVYIVSEGKKYWVLDQRWMIRYGYRWPEDVQTIPRDTLAALPDGGTVSIEDAGRGVVLRLPPETAASRYEGKTIHAAGDPIVYYVTNGKKQRIHGGSTSRDIVVVSEGEIRSLPEISPGAARVPSSSPISDLASKQWELRLVRRPGISADDQKVYVIHDGKRRWVHSARWILDRGCRWPEDVSVISAGELARFPEGESVLANAVDPPKLRCSASAPE
jgi:uncharacterized membrane protein